MRRAFLLAGVGGLATLLFAAILPAPANAATVKVPLALDLFPVDDWLGDGLKSAKDVVFGGLSIGADAIASLLSTTLGALVNLLIPQAFVDAGIGAIKWICAVPSFDSGGGPSSGAYELDLPHVDQLRQMLTWIGVCVLPLGLVYAGGRSVMAPSAYGDSPQDVLARVVFAAAWLAFYSWGWDAVTHFSTLVSDGLLSIDWVADGIEDLMGGLAIGSKIPVAAFAVLIVQLLVALALIAMLMMKIALLVITTFLFVIGGLIGALYPLPFGRKLVGGYCVAVTAVVALPALWALLFTLAAALMLDAGSASGGGGDFGALITQIWVLGATFATFAIAIKLGFSAFGLATSTITSFTAGALAGGVTGSNSGSSPTQTAQKAHSLYSVGNRAGQRSGGTSVASGGSRGVEGVQRTRESAEGLRGAVGSSGAARTAATAGAAAATGGGSGGAQAAAGAGKAATGAAQTAPKAALDRAANGGAGQATARPSTAPGEPSSVRSTPSASDGDVSPTPASPPAAPPDSARQTPAPRKDAGNPPSPPQNPPRGPRRSDGGER